jgi:circadian clock protein KaiC
MNEKTEQREPSAPDMLATGVRGLDTLLHGGFLRGGVCIVQGNPGAGKTILGNQICFNHAAAGGKALYVTLLAESHSRMLLHLRSLSFFDEAAIPDSVYYVSAFPALEQDGLHGLLDLLRREVQARGVTVLVLDGLGSAEETAETPREFRKFVHELQNQAALASCTMFLLTSAGPQPQPPPPEHTMVDAVVELATRIYGRRAERSLEVLKRRGRNFLRGRHSFRITDAGLVVFPRIEALLEKPSREDHVEGTKIPTNIPRLDVMLGGGFPDNSTTMLLGPAGAGKTTLGLHYLGGASAAAPGLFFGLFETPARLLLKARTLNLPIEQLLKDGHVEILWQPTTEGVLDEIGDRLLEAVERRKVRRLVIDGFTGIEKLSPDPERLSHFFTALNLEFRSRGVTTIFTVDLNPVGAAAQLPLTGLSLLQGTSNVAENVVALRFVELRARRHRLISVLKVRDSDFDSAMHAYVITEDGILIDASSTRAEAILAEALRQTVRFLLPPPRADRLPSRHRRES